MLYVYQISLTVYQYLATFSVKSVAKYCKHGPRGSVFIRHSYRLANVKSLVNVCLVSGQRSKLGRFLRPIQQPG